MARFDIEVKRLHEAREKLKQLVIKTGDGSMKGLLAGGLLIQRRAQKKTPVEYGFLRASAFSRKAQDGSLAVEVGYGAAYAKFVHEKTAEKLRGKPRRSGIGTYWNPGESRFLEKAYLESVDDVVNLVKAHTKTGVS